MFAFLFIFEYIFVFRTFKFKFYAVYTNVKQLLDNNFLVHRYLKNNFWKLCKWTWQSRK